MDITKARKLVKLSKEDKEILVTLWDGDKISTCMIEEDKKQTCETCQGDEECCQSWINHLKEKGYRATEIELGEIGLEESLPKFLEYKERDARPEVITVEKAEPQVKLEVEVERKETRPEEAEVDLGETD